MPITPGPFRPGMNDEPPSESVSRTTPEVNVDQDVFDKDLQAFKTLALMLGQKEEEFYSPEKPSGYEFCVVADRNPFDKVHMGESIMAHKGFDIMFSEKPYEPSTFKRSLHTLPDQVTTDLASYEDPISVWTPVDQTTANRSIFKILTMEGHPYSSLLFHIALGDVPFDMMDPEKIKEYYDIHHSKKWTHARLPGLRVKYGTSYSKDPDAGTDGIFPSVDELIESDLYIRGYMTSCLCLATRGLFSDKHETTDIGEKKKETYKKLSGEGYKPFNPEDLYGFMEGLVSDVLKRYPGLLPEKTHEDEAA